MFYDIRETEFLDSLTNDIRKRQIGQDQRDAYRMVYEFFLPQLEDGVTQWYLSKPLNPKTSTPEELEAEKESKRLTIDVLGIGASRSDKAMKRLRKDFLQIMKKANSFQSSATLYTVNKKYLKVGKVQQRDLYRMWTKQDGNDVKFASCLNWCRNNNKTASVKNMLIAEKLFNEGKIVKVKTLP